MGVLLATSGRPVLTASGGVGLSAEQRGSGSLAPLIGDMDLVHTAYVGESLPLDFSDSFAGDITGVSPAVPHSISGRTVTISPPAPSPTATYTVSAGTKSVQIKMKAVAAPAPLAASGTPLSYTVEVNRPMPRQAWFLYHKGGVPPYSYQQVAGPSWVETRAGGSRGRAPATPAAPQTVTVRVTDQRGATIDLSCTVTVIATRSRPTTNAMKASDASIAAAISRMGLGSGDVLYIPAALGVVQAGALSISASRDNPLIILGQTGAVVATPAYFRNSTGVIVENLVFQWQHNPGVGAVWGVFGGDHVWFYNCGFKGRTFTVNPNDGQNWENKETFAYGGKGLRMESIHCVADGCYADKIDEGFHLRGLLIDCECRDFRDDMVVFQECLSGAEVNFRGVRAPTGNRFPSQHEDLIQGFSDSAPTNRHIEIYGRFSSGEGSDLQGMWCTHTAFLDRGGDLAETWQHIYIGHSVFLAGTWNAFSFQRWYDFVLENVVILIHPDASWSRDARIRHWHTSKGVIRNSIFASLDGGDPKQGATGDSYQHLIKQQNNRLLPQSNRAAYSTVFPAYENTALSTFDRMRLSPAWVAANPGVGPAMLGA
jgi:hypothetical protein